MRAFWTWCVSRVSKFPSGFTPEDVLLSLSGKIGDASLNASNNTMDVGAGTAFEAQSRIIFVSNSLVGNETV